MKFFSTLKSTVVGDNITVMPVSFPWDGLNLISPCTHKARRTFDLPCPHQIYNCRSKDRRKMKYL